MTEGLRQPAAGNKVPWAIQYCDSHLLREVQGLEPEFPETAEVKALVSTVAPPLPLTMGLCSQPRSDPEFARQAVVLKGPIIATMDARTNLAGAVRLAKVVFDRSFLDGTNLWWLNQNGTTCLVPAKANIAVTADARAQAAAGEDLTLGRRAHTRRHGQDKAAWSERLETEVVGITGLTTYDQYGAPEQARQANRRDFQANPIHAVVVRQWSGKDYSPGGRTVFLTNAPVEKPLQVFDDYDDRSLIENCCIKAAKQQWEPGYPPQKNDRAVRVHVVFTLLMFALATAYCLQDEREARGEEPVSWQRWRRQLLEQTCDQVIVFAQGHYGIFHLAEYSLLLGVQLKDVPPEIGSRQRVLANYGLPARG